MKKKRLTTIIKKLYEGLVSYLSPSDFTYMWILESMALICLIIQIVSGLFLSMFYKSDISIVFIVIGYINRELYYGWLVRYIYMNGTSIFFLTVYLHMAKHILYGSNSYPRQVLWFSGMLIFFSMMAIAFMVYVLSWGQMSLWGVTIVENVTLSRFNNLHFIFIFIIAALSIIHSIFLYKLRAKKKEKGKSKVYNGGKKGLKKNINRVQKRKMYRIISYERKKNININKIQKRRMFRIGNMVGIWRKNQNISGGGGKDPHGNRSFVSKSDCEADIKKSNFKLYKFQKNKLNEVLEKLKNEYHLNDKSLNHVGELLKHTIITFNNSQKYTLTHSSNVPCLLENNVIKHIPTKSVLDFTQEGLLMDQENWIELNQLINVLSFIKEKKAYHHCEVYIPAQKEYMVQKTIIGKGKHTQSFKDANKEYSNALEVDNERLEHINQLEDYILNDYIPKQMGDLYEKLVEILNGSDITSERILEIMPWLIEQNIHKVTEYEDNLLNFIIEENLLEVNENTIIRTGANSLVINRQNENDVNLNILDDILENTNSGFTEIRNMTVRLENEVYYKNVEGNEVFTEEYIPESLPANIKDALLNGVFDN